MNSILVDIPCDYCGATFSRKRKEVNHNSKKGYKNYCSETCRILGRGQTPIVSLACGTCGTAIEKYKCVIDRSESGLVFCSRSCANVYGNTLRVGENNPNYVDGEGSYRELALNHYGRQCTICGYDIEPVLEVHHRNKNRSDNRVENLDVLCRNHHKEFHLGMRKY